MFFTDVSYYLFYSEFKLRLMHGMYMYILYGFVDFTCKGYTIRAHVLTNVFVLFAVFVLFGIY